MGTAYIVRRKFGQSITYDVSRGASVSAGAGSGRTLDGQRVDARNAKTRNYNVKGTLN